MKKTIFITGGQRSGKSSFAQSLAESASTQPIYVATARHWDEDFEKRIQRHQSERGEFWKTIEEEKAIHTLHLEGETVLLDCITLWLTNIFHDNHYDLDTSVAEAKELWDKFCNQNFTLIVVSNEIGMCMHSPDKSSRHFADLQGWINQHIAAKADTVYTVMSGIPIKIKGSH